MAGKRVPSHVKKICDLLKNERPEYQRAAAMVLGELGLKDSYIVRSLGDLLNNGDDRALKNHILNAFEKIRSKESLHFILPFLFNTNSKDIEFAHQAIAIASSLGNESAREMKAMLKKATPQERCIINSIFIKMHTLEGLKVVLESLQDENEEVVNELCRLMKEETANLTPNEKKIFSTKIEDFLHDKRSVKNRHTISSAIKILGFIGCVESQSTLMAFTTLQNHPYIRSQALTAMKDISLSSNTRVEMIKKLMSYLDESDFSNIVSPTMDILLNIPFQTRMADMVIRLLENHHDAVKRFAVKKMRELNSPKVVKVLVDLLSDSDSSIRDLAAESLCWLDSARTILLDRIIQEDDLELCWLFAKILKPHATKFRSNQIMRLTEHLEKLLDDSNSLQEPFLHLLRTVAPDYLHEIVLNRSRKFKKKKNYKGAVESLNLLQKDGHFGDDARFELAVCHLKLCEKKGKAKRQESSQCFSLFQHLIKEESFPLLDRLKKEKAFEREDLYFLANHFIDKLQAEREFSSSLLKLLVSQNPRSKVAMASRKLLKATEA